MLGDSFWKDSLWERYQRHVERNPIPLPYEPWAIEQAWGDFTRFARLVLALPEFALEDWETHNPVPKITGQHGKSVMLARKLVGGLVTVRKILEDMKEWDRAMAYSVRQYLSGKGQRWSKEKLGAAKPWVYKWLVAAAERDK